MNVDAPTKRRVYYKKMETLAFTVMALFVTHAARAGTAEGVEAFDRLLACEVNSAVKLSDTNPQETAKDIANIVYLLCESIREKMLVTNGLPVEKADELLKAASIENIISVVMQRRATTK
jgi:hypothetical protein